MQGSDVMKASVLKIKEKYKEHHNAGQEKL